MRFLGSFYVTIGAMMGLMGIVCLGTVFQVNAGLYWVLDHIFNTWLIWTTIFGITIPCFPGGWTIGTVFVINLIAKWIGRPITRHNMGLVIIHSGIAILLVGAGISSRYAEELQLILPLNSPVNYAENHRVSELAISKILPKSGSESESSIVAISPIQSRQTIDLPEFPFIIQVIDSYPNVVINRRPMPLPFPANRGIGLQVDVIPTRQINQQDGHQIPAALIDIQTRAQFSVGRWWVSHAFSEWQPVAINGQSYEIQLRPQRTQLGVTVQLDKFIHDMHPGTTIPAKFSSTITLNDPKTGEKRRAEISMNHPLRYRGYTWYQASFSENGNVSVLQLVKNPGWTVPYLACGIISIGLIYHLIAIWYRRKLTQP